MILAHGGELFTTTTTTDTAYPNRNWVYSDSEGF